MVHPIIEEAPAPRALDKTGTLLASAVPPHDASTAGCRVAVGAAAAAAWSLARPPARV